MTRENQNEPLALNDKPMNAWEAAAAMGIDMSLIEYNLSLTPDERVRFHDSKLRLFTMLEVRAEKERGSSQCRPLHTSCAGQCSF